MTIQEIQLSLEALAQKASILSHELSRITGLSTSGGITLEKRFRDFVSGVENTGTVTVHRKGATATVNTTPKTSPKAPKRGARTWTPEQKAEQARKLRAAWARKKKAAKKDKR